MSRNLLFLIAAALVSSAAIWHLAGVEIFTAGGAGLVLAVALGFMGIAITIALIPAGIYWLAKRRRMPYLSGLIWALWGLLTAAQLVQALRLG